MQRRYFNFHGITLRVQSRWEKILEVLEKDFSYFIMEPRADQRFHMELVLEEEDPPYEKVPKMVASMQTVNSICYDHESLRYNDYYGELLSILDFEKETAILYSRNFSKMHEVAYLIILSRVGKLLDLGSLHKLHAFSVSYKDIAVVCMMPMKGGKSTLLTEFLKDSRFKIISDDIPLVDYLGQIAPFPIKIGLNDKPLDLNIVEPEKNVYSMERGQYGLKWLVSLKGLPGRVEESEKRFKRVLLIEAFRYNFKSSVLKEASWLKSFSGLFKHGIIGIGLPMVLEYFWEKGSRDFFIKTFIFFSRLSSFFCLSLRAKKMKLLLGKDPSSAAAEIIRYLEKSGDKI